MRIVKLDRSLVDAFVEFRTKSKAESEFLNAMTAKRALEIIDEYKDENSLCLVARDGDEIVGQLFLNFFPEIKTVQISLISVLDSYKGKGLALVLLANAISYAKEMKAVNLKLYVKKTNTRAIKFYESRGFKIFQAARNNLIYVRKVEQ